jgi:uroporphyrinogen-III synthase
VAKTKDLEHKVARLEREMVLVQRITRTISRGTADLRAALQAIMVQLVDFMDSDSALLYVVERDELVLVASSRDENEALGQVRMRFSEGLTGWVAREKRLLAISREAYLDPRFKMFKDLPEDTFEAFLSAPVITRGTVIGVMNVQHRDPHHHDGNEMELLNLAGELIGALLLISQSPLAVEDLRPVEVILSAHASLP